MRANWLAVFATAFLCGGSFAADAAAQVVVDRATAIVVAADEQPGVAAAAEDLASDFEKVFGQKARIVHRREDAVGTAVVIGTAPGDAESFSIAARQRDVM